MLQIYIQNDSSLTYLIVRSSVTEIIGKGENKGDFNIFRKEGVVHLHEQTPKPKPATKQVESKLGFHIFIFWCLSSRR